MPVVVLRRGTARLTGYDRREKSTRFSRCLVPGAQLGSVGGLLGLAGRQLRPLLAKSRVRGQGARLMFFVPNYRQLARQLIAATLPRRLLVTSGSAQSNRVYLTFDDGPHPKHTPQLLDVLRN